MKAGIYTRKSTDKQSKASTEDQARNCRAFAAREGMVVTHTFCDEAISGTVRARPDYNAMLQAAEKRLFDVLLVDDLSRLARDATEQGLTLKRLKFLDIRVVGVSEGYDSDAPGEKIHAAVKGILNELYVDNIRFQTKRGLEGRALQGLSAGGRAYGYDSNPVIEKGQVVGHALSINEEQAVVVRRIHRMFADGHSPMTIAAKLNEEGVPSPRGGTWARSAIHGDPKDGSGILNNALYDGRYIWNRARFVTNPDTGKRTRKPNDESVWVVTEVPELRIVPVDVWAKVKARQQAISDKSKLKQAAAGEQARTGAGPKYLLSGLLKCAECGANYVIVDRYRYGCAKHKDRGAAACSNGLKVDRSLVERTVLHALKKRLLTREALERFKSRLSSEASRQLDVACGDVKRAGKRLDDVKRQIGRLIESIKAGIDPIILRDELNHLQQERDVLEREHAQSQGSAPVVSEVIAIAIARYDLLIANLENLLMARIPEARELLKALFGGPLELLPKEDGTLETKMAGMTAGLFSLLALTPDFFTGSQINVVAGAGFEPATFGL